MSLLHLEIKALRNLSAVAIEPGLGFNIFYGENASGKTSILEAIHLLGLGRSFRQSHLDDVIDFSSDSSTIFAQLHSETLGKRSLGVEKPRKGKFRAKLDGSAQQSLVEIAELLPIQIIHPDSHELLMGVPKVRRQFLDWGVFHVEQNFFSAWKRVQRTLKQRNAALKANLSREQITVWDEEYALASTDIEALRKLFLTKLQEIFSHLVKSLLDYADLRLEYQSGWDETADLRQILLDNLWRDQQLGYTYHGPHRSDILIKVGDHDARDVLSRGQQKLVVIALSLAQGKLLQQLANKNCIYLIDDLAAEIDLKHKIRLAQTLLELKSQVFITAIELNDLQPLIDLTNARIFHVELGSIKTL